MYLFYLLSFDGSIALDDTYHEAFIKNNSSQEYLIQSNPKAAFLILANSDFQQSFKLESKKVNEETYQEEEFLETKRQDPIVEYKYVFSGNEPLKLKMNCISTTNDCLFTYMYVHTQPVFRKSVVFGSLSIFINLFIFIFSWALFCGACRATRKR